MIIAIDFDGTIHNGVWPAIGEPLPGAKEAINNLRAEGHYIIIWTCREGVQQTEMVNWLLARGIGFDRVNDHNPAQVSLYKNNSRKVYAHVYIDDKNIGGLPSWGEIALLIRRQEEEYQAKVKSEE